MANESTAASISTFINDIWEAAVLVSRDMSIVAPLVRNFSQPGINDRYFSRYTGGTVTTLAETTDLTSQTFTPGTIAKLTPALYGAQYFLTDLRVDSDPFNVRMDAASDLGQLLAKQVDTHLVGTFTSFTGGTVGSAGGTLTWADIMKGRSYLRRQMAMGEVYAVLEPGQWYYLANTIAAGQTVTNMPGLQDRVSEQFYVGSVLGVNFFIDANITSGTAAKGGMFVRDAAALDIRRALRIEPQRDASRGGGGWELNATMDYAHGVWDATKGVQLIGTSVL